MTLAIGAGALALACAPAAPTTGYEHLNVEIDAQIASIGLGPGDVFELRVYGEEHLSGDYRIAPDGSIDFPLVGRMDAAGKTPTELAEHVRAALQDGYIRNPYVSVYIKEYNSQKIFVLGEVQRPGTFPYANGMNVVESITLAGGFKDTANVNYVVVTRKVNGEEMRIPVPVEKISKGMAANLTLQAGDIVFVPDRLL